MEATEAGGPGTFDLVLHWIATAIEASGVAAIVFGCIAAIAVALACRRRGGTWDDAYHAFRTSLARGILLGLEFLVAADIIGTVAVEPTLQNLAVLGLIVLIRTFLSFSLQLEIEGRWPWQRAAEAGASRPSP